MALLLLILGNNDVYKINIYSLMGKKIVGYDKLTSSVSIDLNDLILGLIWLS